MANVKFLSGSYAQYSTLAVKDTNALYFVDGQLFKGDVAYTDQIVVVASLPDILTAGKVYVNTTDKSITYFDGTSATVVVPATVGSIGDSTPDTNLANVKAIKDFVAVEIAKIPVQTNYTVTLTNKTAGENDLTKQILKQGAVGKESEIGTIVVPKLVIDSSATDANAAATYKIIYGGTEVGKINIPKDLVVTQDGSEIVKVDDGHPIEGLTNGTYLKLGIQNNDKPVYINVTDLGNVYTGKTAIDGVRIAISDTNEISATLVGRAVTQNNLEDTLSQKINGAVDSYTWGSIT